MFDRLRAAWRAFWNGSTAITLASPAPDAPKVMKIHPAALWEAARQGSRPFQATETFAPARPIAGTLPDGMAFDAALPGDITALTSYAMEQMQHEGLGFLGYPYLAELSQRAEYRKIASIWAEHCTRKWVKLKGDDAKVEQLNEWMDGIGAREAFRQAIEKECFFGRFQLFMDFGDWNKPEELQTPLAIAPEKISPKRPLKRLTPVEPMWSYPGMYDAQNPLAPDFYRPSAWYVSGRTVHASRLLTMVGHEMPNMLKPAYAFGGVALTQMCKPYVDNWLRTRQSTSDLVHAFSVMVLKTDLDSALQGGSNAVWTGIFDRIDMFNKTRDNRGTFVIDKGTEDFANVAAPIAGLDKLLAQSQEQMSSVSGIPLVVLLGVTPSGLNASSDGEIRIFYDAILAYLEKTVGPAYQTLLEVAQLSLFGEIDPKIDYEFIPLWEMSDTDRAAIRKSDAEADGLYIDKGVVDPEEVRQRLDGEEGGMYKALLAGPAPEAPEDGGEEDALLPGLA